MIVILKSSSCVCREMNEKIFDFGDLEDGSLI